MKCIVYLTSGILILSLWIAGSPIQLKSFESLYKALKEGSRVRAVLHYKDMKLFNEIGESVEDIQDAVGGIDLAGYSESALTASKAISHSSRSRV